MIPWEEVRGPAAVQKKLDSPPPTFAFATATATNLTDRHEVVNDSSQGLLARFLVQIGTDGDIDIWDEHTEMAGIDMSAPSRTGTPGPLLDMPPGLDGATGRLRTRVPHGMPGDHFEMVSAPVNRR